MKLKSLLLIIAIIFSFTTFLKAQLSSDSKIVAQWKFDEGSGTTAADTKGTSNGTLYNLPASAWIDGLVGKAIDFNTGDAASYVEVADNSIIDFNSTTSFTFSLLMKVSDISGTDMNFIWKGATGKNTADEKGHWYGMLFKTNQLRLAVDDDAAKTQLGYSDAHLTMNMEGWNHIVGVRDISAVMLYLYINGEKVAEMADGTTGDITSTPLPLVIGNNNNHDRNFLGAIDELTMYNAALTADEIKALYTKYTSPTSVSKIDISNILKPECNPVSDQLRLTNASTVKSIEIYNITGACVKTVKNNGAEIISTNISALPKGRYFVKGNCTDAIVTNSFIKH